MLVYSTAPLNGRSKSPARSSWSCTPPRARSTRISPPTRPERLIRRKALQLVRRHPPRPLPQGPRAARAPGTGPDQQFDIDLWVTSNLFPHRPSHPRGVFEQQFPRFDRNTNSGKRVSGLTPISCRCDQSVCPRPRAPLAPRAPVIAALRAGGADYPYPKVVRTMFGRLHFATISDILLGMKTFTVGRFGPPAGKGAQGVR